MELPQAHYLAQFLENIDPTILNQAYQEFYQQMSAQVNDIALSTYQELEERQLGQSAKDVELRDFKNSLLSYLYKDDNSKGAPLFYEQYKKARNMTDSLAALNRMSHHGGSEFIAAMEDFRNKWQHDSLVMNKYFMITATSKADNAFDKIKNTFNSKDFDKTNPNNIFALIYYFAQYNWAHFHTTTGDAYNWFAEQTIDVDSRNPQVASRLGSCFNNWKKMAPQYQKPMKNALLKIRDSKPSDNLFEIVGRALKQDI